jgi:hypothetical protein
MFSVLLYVVSGHWRSARQVVRIYHYLSLVGMIVGGFSIVIICSERLFIIYLSPICRWFADKVVYLWLLLYICGSMNFVWLSICYSWLSKQFMSYLCGRSVLFQTERWECFLL